MPRIIVQADDANGAPGTVTLAERVIPTGDHSDHYLTQLVERVGWALVDAEELEASQTDAPVAPVAPVRAGARGRGRSAGRGRRTVLGPRYQNLSRTGPATPR